MRTPSTLFLVLAGSFATAQSWCPPGAQWKFDTGGPWSVSHTLLTYAGDTVIDGYDAQVIERTLRMIWLFGNDTLVNEQQPSAFTRTDGDVVWEWNGSVWDTLYWFSAVPGDEWQPFWAFGETCPDHVLHVIDTSTVVVDGLPLRSLSVELYDAGVPMGFPFIFDHIERIGGYGGNVFPGLPPCGPIYECFCSYLCYEDEDISHPDPNGTCELTLDIQQEESTSATCAVFPDPVTDRVTFCMTGEAIDELIVFDPQGGVVLRERPGTPLIMLDLSHLAEGSYAYAIHSAHATARGSLIKL